MGHIGESEENCFRSEQHESRSVSDDIINHDKKKLYLADSYNFWIVSEFSTNSKCVSRLFDIHQARQDISDIFHKFDFKPFRLKDLFSNLKHPQKNKKNLMFVGKLEQREDLSEILDFQALV